MHPLANKYNWIISFQRPNIKIEDQNSLKDQLVFAFTASGVLLWEPCMAFLTLGKNKRTQFVPITCPRGHEWVRRQFSPRMGCLHSIRMTENAFMWLIHSDLLLTGVNVLFWRLWEFEYVTSAFNIIHGYNSNRWHGHFFKYPTLPTQRFK